MPTYNSMSALKADLQKRLRKAMEVSREAAEANAYEATGGFYTGSPKQYVRTGNLGSSPRTTSVSGGGDTYSFEVYLDTSNPYNTGTWSTPQVFNAANNEELVGSGRFWEQTVNDTRNDVLKIFHSFF